MFEKWVYLRAVILISIMIACSAFGGLTASGPSPSQGEVVTDRDANLIWTPGTQAASHNVYLGTDYDQVNNTPLIGNIDANETTNFADVKFLPSNGPPR